MEKSANGILKTTIEKVRDLVDVSTIIGDPINLPDGLTIIPVSKVTYGFASGGSDFPSKNKSLLIHNPIPKGYNWLIESYKVLLSIPVTKFWKWLTLEIDSIFLRQRQFFIKLLS